MQSDNDEDIQGRWEKGYEQENGKVFATDGSCPKEQCLFDRSVASR